MESVLQEGNASPNAVASLNIPESSIPYSKTDLNAYAVQAEDQLLEVLPMAQAGIELQDLLTNPQRFPEYTEVYMQQMLRVPGGLDVTNNAFGPILAQANAADPRVQALRQQMQQQQQQQQSPQPRQFSWNDGGMPLANGATQPMDVGGMISAGQGQMSWQAVDRLSQAGAFRGRPLIQLDA